MYARFSYKTTLHLMFGNESEALWIKYNHYIMMQLTNLTFISDSSTTENLISHNPFFLL